MKREVTIKNKRGKRMDGKNEQAYEPLSSAEKELRNLEPVMAQNAGSVPGRKRSVGIRLSDTGGNCGNSLNLFYVSYAD